MPIECETLKEFLYNDRFDCTKGEQFFDQGRLKFQGGREKADGSYKTVFGLYFYHPGIVYKKSNHNLELAFNYRLCNQRKVERPGFHDELKSNQDTFLDNNSEIHHFIAGVQQKLILLTLDAKDTLEMMGEYVELPNAKRRERIMSLAWIRDWGFELHDTYLFKKSVVAVKGEEFNNPLKFPRVFVSLGSTACLIAGFVIDFVKESMNGHSRDGYELEFIKSPDKGVLTDVFAKLMTPKWVYFPFFSDDSCISIRCEDGVSMGNVDISTCDGSHFATIFTIYTMIVSVLPRMIRLLMGALQQLLHPLVVRSYTGKKQDRVVLEPTGFLLKTGSILTTVINNIANVCGYCAVVDELRRRRSLGIKLYKHEVQQLVQDAFEKAGYITTYQVCETYHNLQFLKHSPVMMSDGQIRPILNLGVILRCWGSSWGDLPHGKHETVAEAAYAWNRQLMLSLVHAGNHPLTASLRQKYSRESLLNARAKALIKTRVTTAFQYKIDTVGDGSTAQVDSDEVMKRYGLPGFFLDEICYLIAQSGDGAGECIETYGSQSIISEDYGYDYAASAKSLPDCIVTPQGDLTSS